MLVAMILASTGLSFAQSQVLSENPESKKASSDWTRFRGPNGTGISSAKTVPTEWTSDDYNWVAELPGKGHGSPVVVGDRLYLVCGEEETAERIVACFDTKRGDMLWQRKFASKTHRLHLSNSYGSSTPASDTDGVVVTWADPDQLVLMALDPQGETVWSRDLGPHDAINGAGTSPIIVDDVVVLMNVQMDANVLVRAGVLPEKFADDQPNESFLIAVDRGTGETRWQVDRETYLCGYATPCVRNLQNGEKELIFLDSAHGLTGIDIRNGEVRWQTSRLLPTRTVASPVIAGNLIFCSHGQGVTGDVIYAVRVGDQGEEPQIEYEIKKAAPLTPTPIVQGELAFLWSDSGIVTCITAETGEVLWRQRVGGNYYGSPVWIDERLYCVDRRGTVVVIAADREFKLLAKVPLGETSFATPAVASGTIYFRTETRLFSLGGKP